MWYRLLHPRIATIVVCGENPMTLAWHTPAGEKFVAIAVDKENYTYELIKNIKDFSINILSKNFLKDVWICGTKSGRDVNKLSLVNFSLEDGVKIRSKHIKEALGFIECKLHKEINLGDHSLIIGKVVYWRARDFRAIWRRNDILMHLGSRYFCIFSRYFTTK